MQTAEEVRFVTRFILELTLMSSTDSIFRHPFTHKHLASDLYSTKTTELHEWGNRVNMTFIHYRPRIVQKTVNQIENFEISCIG